MKEGKTLQELAAELERQQLAKKDLIVSTGVLSMDSITMLERLRTVKSGSS